jgi:hypothetical protein
MTAEDVQTLRDALWMMCETPERADEIADHESLRDDARAALDRLVDGLQRLKVVDWRLELARGLLDDHGLLVSYEQLVEEDEAEAKGQAMEP